MFVTLQGALMAFDTLLARRLTLEPSTIPKGVLVVLNGAFWMYTRVRESSARVPACRTPVGDPRVSWAVPAVGQVDPSAWSMEKAMVTVRTSAKSPPRGRAGKWGVDNFSLHFSARVLELLYTTPLSIAHH